MKYTINYFGQTVNDNFGRNTYGSGLYGCENSENCKTQTVQPGNPGAPDTGFGIFPNLSSVSPIGLACAGIVFAIIVASSALFIKKMLRKRSISKNES